MKKKLLSNFLIFIKSIIIYKYYSLKFRKTDFLNNKKLANPKFSSPKFFTSVFLYGNYKAIAKIKNKKFNFITEYLEHGTYYEDNPNSAEQMGYINRSLIKTVYTFSERRKKVLEEYLKIKNLTRNIIPVGPYILGCNNFHSSNELQLLKQKYGKTLVVFPSHSIEYAKSEYDGNTLLEEIQRIKQNFDSILMCFYWMDIIEKRHELYEKAGFTIVTAGHRSDPNFLPRLKDIIQLSNLTMSNNVGTHVGYSICLNKPHYLFSQTLKYNITTNPFAPDGIKNIDSSNINQLFASYFGKFSFEITTEQINFIEEYWGAWSKE